MADYRVEIHDANAHLFRVTLTLALPAACQGLSLPVWAPGSYTVRDFARHLSAIEARQGRRVVSLAQETKARWIAACEGDAALVVSYLVYAFDGSVRGAFLDAGRGFINGPALFLRAEGRDGETQRVSFSRLPAGWQIATAMPARGARRFDAGDYAELIDHPFMLGRFWRGSFAARGVAHEVVVGGPWPSFDGDRLVADTQRICETQIRFWHGRGKPPMRRYVFLLQAGDDGYGGLEHRESAALQATRRDLPRRGLAEMNDGYAGLLGLISHEYFHAWNVMRLKPREHVAPDLDREHPTRLLWFFEGFTSYYDELLLRRAGLIDDARYLRLLARPVNAVQGAPGRRVQSLAAASFDAWTKHYRRDENTANATVSYYDKGALVALLTDLALRAQGRSLDELMRALWKRSAGGPIDEDEIFVALGEPLASDLKRWVHGTAELPLTTALAGAAVRLRAEAPSLAAQIGLKLSEGPISGVQVRQVLRGSAAEAAGLAAGDELLAADGWRLRRLDDVTQWVEAGRGFTLLVSRDQRVFTLRVVPPAEAAAPPLVLSLDDAAPADALALRRAWLGC